MWEVYGETLCDLCTMSCEEAEEEVNCVFGVNWVTYLAATEEILVQIRRDAFELYDKIVRLN